jgi:hypothetical protein
MLPDYIVSFLYTLKVIKRFFHIIQYIKTRYMIHDKDNGSVAPFVTTLSDNVYILKEILQYENEIEFYDEKSELG